MKGEKVREDRTLTERNRVPEYSVQKSIRVCG